MQLDEDTCSAFGHFVPASGGHGVPNALAKRAWSSSIMSIQLDKRPSASQRLGNSHTAHAEASATRATVVLFDHGATSATTGGCALSFAVSAAK